jgi:flagellar protein FliO/FliZ
MIMAASAASTPVGEGLGLAPLVQVAAALALVVLVIFAIAWLLRRLQGGGAAGVGQMKLVAGLALGPRERVLLVEVGGTQLLLGVTPTQITRLHEFPEPVVKATPAGGDFALRLRQALGRGDAP